MAASLSVVVAHPMSAELRSTQRDAIPRQGRRLWDKVLVAFHHACDVDDFQVAELMLGTLEMMIGRTPQSGDISRRRNIQGLIAAHERLWTLRHPGEPD